MLDVQPLNIATIKYGQVVNLQVWIEYVNVSNLELQRIIFHSFGLMEDSWVCLGSRQLVWKLGPYCKISLVNKEMWGSWWRNHDFPRIELALSTCQDRQVGLQVDFILDNQSANKKEDTEPLNHWNHRQSINERLWKEGLRSIVKVRSASNNQAVKEHRRWLGYGVTWVTSV